MQIREKIASNSKCYLYRAYNYGAGLSGELVNAFNCVEYSNGNKWAYPILVSADIDRPILWDNEVPKYVRQFAENAIRRYVKTHYRRYTKGPMLDDYMTELQA